MLTDDYQSKNKEKKMLYVQHVSENSKMSKNHGAVIYKGNKLMCIGHNHNRSCYYGNIMCSTHAEIDVLRKFINNVLYGKISNSLNFYDIRRTMKKYTMYTSRSDKNLLSIPCKDCAEFIFKMGIKKIYYMNESNILLFREKDISSSEKSSVNKKMSPYTKTRLLFY